MPTILVIEDNRTIRENTVEFLQLEGYSILEAANGKEGYAKIIYHVPDIIVCDILMPELGGLELLEKLATHPECKTIPLIFFSAKSEQKDIEKGMGFGAYDYIVKPSDLTDLLASIRRCLSERALS